MPSCFWEHWLINMVSNLQQWHLEFCIIHHTRLIVLFYFFYFCSTPFVTYWLFLCGLLRMWCNVPLEFFPPLLPVSILFSTLSHLSRWLLFVLPLPEAWIFKKLSVTLFLSLYCCFSLSSHRLLVVCQWQVELAASHSLFCFTADHTILPSVIILLIPPEEAECHRVALHRLMVFLVLLTSSFYFSPWHFHHKWWCATQVDYFKTEVNPLKSLEPQLQQMVAASFLKGTFVFLVSFSLLYR